MKKKKKGVFVFSASRGAEIAEVGGTWRVRSSFLKKAFYIVFSLDNTSRWTCSIDFCPRQQIYIYDEVKNAGAHRTTNFFLFPFFFFSFSSLFFSLHFLDFGCELSSPWEVRFPRNLKVLPSFFPKPD